jgi:Domain of unknown function (DUF4258)
MYERVLGRMRQSVRALTYIMTTHAEEEMEDDGLTILDVEHVVLTGSIVERQRDRRTAQLKYVVAGQTEAGENAEVVGRLSLLGKLIILTVYRA